MQSVGTAQWPSAAGGLDGTNASRLEGLSQRKGKAPLHTDSSAALPKPGIEHQVMTLAVQSSMLTTLHY